MTLAAPRTGPGPSLRGWACETAAEGEGGGRRHQGGLEGLGGSPPPAPGRRGALLWVVQHFLKLVRLRLSQDQFQLDLALQHFRSSRERAELGVFSHHGSQDKPSVGHEAGVPAG